MDINSFKSRVTGVARPSLFDIQISGAPIQGLDMDLLQYTCKAASLPASTLGKIEVPFYGRKIPMPGDRTYQEWETTIIADLDWTIYKQLMNWHEKINGSESNRAVTTNINAMSSDARVISYDQTGAVSMIIQMVGIYPQDIQQLELNWESTDQTADIQVTWAYSYSFVLL